MGDDNKVGITAALAALDVKGEAEIEGAEQLAMFATGPLAENDVLDAKALPVPGLKRRGRPPGAPNKSTQQWVEFFLSRHKSPLLVLGEIMNTPTEVLAKRAGCGVFEALKLQKDCAVALAPFIHQRQPQAVEITADALPLLLLGSEVASIDGGEVKTIDGASYKFLEIEQKQELSEEEARLSNDEKSNDDG